MAACASCTARKSLQSVFVAASRSVDDLALQFVCEAPFAEAVIGGGDALKRVLLAVHRENAERQQDESGGREGAHVQSDDAAMADRASPPLLVRRQASTPVARTTDGRRLSAPERSYFTPTWN
jgi:hypothetical protein